MTKISDSDAAGFYSRLLKYPLFNAISPEELKAVLGCVGARVEKYEKNTFIMLDKEDIRGAGLVLEGNVAILKEDEHGHQSLIAYVNEGEVFGETFALSRNRTARASHKAMTKCTILYIPVSRVLDTCRNNCPFHRGLIINLFDCVTRKNAMLIRKIDAISRNTIREKIMAFLTEELALANQENGTPDNRKVAIPLNRMELAQYLSVNRSALARELSMMKQEGLIDVKGRTFTIL